MTDLLLIVTNDEELTLVMNEAHARLQENHYTGEDEGNTSTSKTESSGSSTTEPPKAGANKEDVEKKEDENGDKKGENSGKSQDKSKGGKTGIKI